MPKVSVIIPNFNHAAYLQQRIKSVLNQTYQDFEIILLDDCSTDNSRDVIEHFRNNEKISHIVYNKVNSGNPFIQWDKGIQLATGNYIWIAESDDWCESSLLENILHGLENKSNCVVGYCQSYCVTDDNKIRFQSNHSKLEEYVNGKSFIKKYLVPKNPIFNASMAVWKKDVYNNVSKDYINYKLIGDYCFWIEICAFGDVFICGKLLNYFRNHDKNVSTGTVKSGLSFTEQIPFYKSLFDKKIIAQPEYRQALRTAYVQYRFNKKHMTAQTALAVRKLFSEYSNSDLQLELYFFNKYFRNSLRKFFQHNKTNIASG